MAKNDSLTLHKKYQGKLEIRSKVSIKNKDDLSWAYSPGVSEPCKEIAKSPSEVYTYTSKGNMVLVVTDGSAVLGLGNIGPKAALPVMEGKAILLKEFAKVDAFPICLDTQDTETIIKTIELLAPSFGGINLEDIEAPKCIEIENRLKESLDIPVFHDDQHGTAIVTLAALLNSVKLAKKDLNTLKVVLCGTGAAGSSIARLLHQSGVKTIYAYNKEGVVSKKRYDAYDFSIQALLDDNIISDSNENSLASLVKGSDVFIGVSTNDLLEKDMVRSMNSNPIIFAMANPNPEIDPQAAKEAGAFIVGTGRSDYPNQINNVLAFPGIFKGALQAKISNITKEMMLAAAEAIANVINEEDLTPSYIIPSPFNESVVKAVSTAIIKFKEVNYKKG